ncbi:MAG: ABC transporter ATP-binding protein [Geminicoccales bacterium]
MQFELVRLQHEVGITFIIVTHDQEEALSMADRIAVMDQGKLLQVASPADLYERPNCRMVADFIGKMNFFRARVIGAEGGRLQVEADGLGELEIEGDGQGAADAEIGVRPEKIELSAAAPEDQCLALPCHVTQRAFFGDKSHLYVETEQGHRLICQRPHQADSSFDIGSLHYLVIDPEDYLLLRS